MRKVCTTPRGVRKKNPDPFKLFVTATAYWRAAARLGENLNLRAPYDMPMYVIEAFSLELHLKCLLRIEGQELARTHEPGELYEKLRKDNRKLIRDYTGMNVADLNSVMKCAEGVFKNLKYIHEGWKWPKDREGRWGNFWFKDIILAIRTIIKKEKPRWEKRKNAALAL